MDNSSTKGLRTSLVRRVRATGFRALFMVADWYGKLVFAETIGCPRRPVGEREDKQLNCNLDPSAFRPTSTGRV
jgi:hypothetical protein